MIGRRAMAPARARRHPGPPVREARGLRRLLRRGAALAALVVVLPPLGDALLGLRPRVDGCRVLHVVDGDTVDFRCPGAGVVRARLTGFDTPELYGPRCAAEAAAAVAAQAYLRWTLARAGSLQVAMAGTDRYGRRLAGVHVDGDRLADRMVEGGHARRYAGGARQGWCA
jgi:endonuclease YncB( thermonuclease family)